MTGSSSPISSPSTIPCNSRKKRLAGRVKTVWYIRVHQVLQNRGHEPFCPLNRVQSLLRGYNFIAVIGGQASPFKFCVYLAASQIARADIRKMLAEKGSCSRAAR